MSYLLWFALLLLAAIPPLTCLVYYYRRLGTRREMLKQTLISLQLEDAYMSARHGEIESPKRKEMFEQCFRSDFRAGSSFTDYLWPATLVTVIALIGWFLTFSHAYPPFTGLVDVSKFPDYFAYGFAGAFFAALLTVFDEFRTFNLDPNVYYALAYRLLFSSTAAYLAAQLFKDTFSPLVAFGVGLFPVEKAWKVITDKASQAVGATGGEGEPGVGLAVVQGLEDQRNRKKLVDVDISTVQALATADPFWLFFQTTLPLRTIVDMMDKAILYLYIGEAVEGLRKHGINGVIELAALVRLSDQLVAYGPADAATAADPFFKGYDSAKLLESLKSVLNIEADELKAFIYNLYYDPLVKLLYSIWGRYLDPDALEPAAHGSAVRAATAGSSGPRP